MRDRERVVSFPIFEGLSPAELDDILFFGQEMAFDNEPILFEDSSLTTHLFLLLEGRVSVEIETPRLAPECSRIQLAILREGNVFGEMAFLEGKRRSAYVAAIERVRVLKLDGRKLREHFETHLHAGFVVMRNLALILAERLEEINFMWRDDIRRLP